jgi:flagellin
MGMRVSTNVAAINAQRNLTGTQRSLTKSMAQLSSGLRINQAADDAAGLAISENLKAQIRSGRQASRNANDGISMVQTAEGGLNEISNIVVRLRELGIQAASDTVGQTERGFLNKEVMQLKAEVDRISNVTTWGSTKLLDGSNAVFDFQVGLFENPKKIELPLMPRPTMPHFRPSAWQILIIQQKKGHKMPWLKLINHKSTLTR